jgi:hypothetical protein
MCDRSAKSSLADVPTLGMSKPDGRPRRIGEGRVSRGELEQGDVMSQYMLLLYAPEVDEAEGAEREAEYPVWRELNESLREAGLLVASGRLHDVPSATTVRVRDGDAEMTDGPFAVTKEILAGYYLLECGDLDEALRVAARVPLARYGSVEVRPIMEVPELQARSEAAAGQA